MADRYWVGGSANWDVTAGTKWATTSGGAGGAAVPTASDDVFLNAASGAVTVTIAASSMVCRSLDCNGFTGTLTYSQSTLRNLTIGTSTVPASNIALRLSAGMTLAILAIGNDFTFVGTNTTAQTITTAGKTMPNLTFSGSTGRWQFTDGLTATGATITYSSSSTAVLDFNGQAVTAGSIVAITGTTKTWTLGSSAITLTSATPLQVVNGIVMTANTAVFTYTGASTTTTVNAGAAATFNFNGSSIVIATGVTGTIFNSNSTSMVVTVANLTVTGSAIKTAFLTHGFASFVVTGTLTLGGNTTQGVNRLLVQSGTVGTQKTFACAGGAVVITGDVVFMDIDITGSPSWTNTGSAYIGDALGNGALIVTNRTTPSTRYKIAGGFSDWSSSGGWAASSGGTTDNRVPLPQDNVIFDGNSQTGTVNIAMPMSGANLTLASGYASTLNFGTTTSFFGSLTLNAAATITGTSTLTLQGRGSHTVTTAGKTVTPAVILLGPGGTYTQTDAYTTNRSAAGSLNISSGTWNTGNFALDITGVNGSFQSTPTAAVATFIGGTSTITFGTTNGTFWSVNANTILSVASTTIVVGIANTQSRTFAGAGWTYGTLRYTVADSPGPLLITGANTFSVLEVGPEHRMSLTASITQNVTTPTLAGRNNGYQRMTGIAVSGNITIPDSAALSALTDMDIRVRASLDDVTPAAVSMLVAKSGTGATSTEFEFRVMTTGLLQLNIGDASSTTGIPSTVAPTVTDGVVYWWRVTRRASDGRVQFFTAPDNASMPSSWTQVGTNVTNSKVMGDLTNPVTFGAAATASGNTVLNPMAGKYYRAQIRNNVLDDGTGIQADVDFTTKAFGANTFTEGSSNAATVTIFDLAQMGDGRVHVISSTGGTPAYIAKPFTDAIGNVVTFQGAHITQNSDRLTFSAAVGVGDGATIPDSAGVSFTSASDIDLRALVTLTDWTPAAVNYLITKVSGAGATFYEYLFYVDTAGKLTLRSADGISQNTTNACSVATGFADGSKNWVRVTRRGSDGQLKFWSASGAIANPVTADWTQMGANATNQRNHDGAGSVIFGAMAGTAGGLIGDYYRAQIRNNILDDGTGIQADVSFAPTNVVSEDYMRLVDSAALGATWYAGSHSADGGGNTGWSFTDAPAASTADDFFMAMAV